MPDDVQHPRPDDDGLDPGHDLARAALAALAEREERYRLVSRAAHDLIFEYDVPRDHLRLSDVYSTVLGYEQREFDDALEWWQRHMHPADLAARDEFARALASDEPVWRGEFRFRRADGGWAHLRGSATIVRDGRGAPRLMVGALQDITERLRLEEQLRRAQKMEAVGQLAGGVAHDFNNLLTVINAAAELLAQGLAGERPASTGELLDEVRAIGEAVRRAADLTRRLLAFSRRQPVAPRPVAVVDVVRAVEGMAGRVLGADIELVVLPADAGRARVHADAGELEQALLNLVINARDAMPHGGVVVIEHDVATLAEHDARLARGARPGRYALVAVTDTGHGMDAATLEHVFEPFFTTKPAGRGTGLGLALVYGVVTAVGGFVSVRSEPGRGTTFELFLPAHDADDAREAHPAAAEPAREHAWGAVLVVEDETAVRAAAARVLRSAGFEVLEARHGADALRLLHRRAGHEVPVRLVVADVVMPEMGGTELATRLASAMPRLPVVLMSGYPSPRVDGVRVPPDTRLVAKPFTADVLMRAVRDALAGGERDAPPVRDAAGSRGPGNQDHPIHPAP